MIERRFQLTTDYKGNFSVPINDDLREYDSMMITEVVHELNALYKENEQYKLLLQDMGLLLSDKDIQNIRSQICDKIFIPLIESQGYSVKDIDISNGFNITLRD